MKHGQGDQGEESGFEHDAVTCEFKKRIKTAAEEIVDKAEQAYNAAADTADQMARQIALYPIQIKEAQSSLVSARARLAVAATNLARCTVKAPFNARIKTAAIETGQYVSPGQNVLTLADDTILEIIGDYQVRFTFPKPDGLAMLRFWFFGQFAPSFFIQEQFNE